MPARKRKTEWETFATRQIKAVMRSGRVDYAELAHRLKGMGIEETARSLSHKINRGDFSFAFFIQCSWAIDPRIWR